MGETTSSVNEPVLSENNPKLNIDFYQLNSGVSADPWNFGNLKKIKTFQFEILQLVLYLICVLLSAVYRLQLDSEHGGQRNRSRIQVWFA